MNTPLLMEITGEISAAAASAQGAASTMSGTHAAMLRVANANQRRVHVVAKFLAFGFHIRQAMDMFRARHATGKEVIADHVNM